MAHVLLGSVPVILLLAVVVGAHSTLAEDISGTYELLLCKQACSFDAPSTASARGTVVIFDRAMAPWEIDRVDPHYVGSVDERLRGCFAATKVIGERTSAAGYEKGLVAVAKPGDALQFTLYRSPGRGYSVVLTKVGDGFSGTGAAAAAGTTAHEDSTDAVVARRVGPADISHCTRST